MPTRKAKKLKRVDAVARELKVLDDYDMSLDGQGPPRLPAFVFDCQGSYDFSVECHLRAEVDLTSDWHDDIPSIMRSAEVNSAGAERVIGFASRLLRK